MKVKPAQAVLSCATSDAIRFAVEFYPEEFTKDDLTTAFFIEQFDSWYSLMTSRSSSLAFSLANPAKRSEKISSIERFLELIASMKLHVNQKDAFKPLQIGIMLTTKSMLQLQEHYLKVCNFVYVLPGRLTNDCVENFFSTVRGKNPNPTPLYFKRVVKALSMSQMLKSSINGSYNIDDHSGFLTDLKDFKDMWEKSSLEEDQDTLEDVSFVTQTLDSPSDFAEDCALAYIAGYFLKKTISGTSECKTCEDFYVNKFGDTQASNTLIFLKEYKDGALKRPSAKANAIFKEAEEVFKIHRDRFRKEASMSKKLTKIIVSHLQQEFPDIPSCHVTLIFSRFTRARLHFYADLTSTIQKKDQSKKIANEAHSSKSGMAHIRLK